LTEYEKAGKLFYFPLVQAPDENWTLGTGRITPKMIEELMPPKSKLLRLYLFRQRGLNYIDMWQRAANKRSRISA
jgi:hypothetical protein